MQDNTIGGTDTVDVEMDIAGNSDDSNGDDAEEWETDNSDGLSEDAGESDNLPEVDNEEEEELDNAEEELN